MVMVQHAEFEDVSKIIKMLLLKGFFRIFHVTAGISNIFSIFH